MGNGSTKFVALGKKCTGNNAGYVINDRSEKVIVYRMIINWLAKLKQKREKLKLILPQKFNLMKKYRAIRI